MATFTTYANGTSTVNTAKSAASFPAITTLEQTFDATKRPLAASDVVELISVPAGTQVHSVYYEVMSVDAAQTFDIGDGTDIDAFVAAASAATEGRGMGAGAGVGKFYADADTIDLNVPATMALDTLKVRVVAMVTMMG